MAVKPKKNDQNSKSISNITEIIRIRITKMVIQKIKINFNLYLPSSFSNFFWLEIILLQKFKIYDMNINVFSEIVQDIFVDVSRHL